MGNIENKNPDGIIIIPILGGFGWIVGHFSGKMVGGLVPRWKLLWER